MQVFLAVLKDLCDFALGRDKEVANLGLTSLAVESDSDNLEKEIGVSKSDVFEEKEAISLGEIQVAYIAVNVANIFLRPVWTVDGVLGKVSYAEKVLVYEYSGRFALIKYKSITGWIMKDDLTQDQVIILPEFTEQKVYLSEDLETKKLRKIIGDEFFTSELYLPLLDIEFVTYKLKQVGLSIPWGSERPRLAGNWHNIIKGKLGIKIGIRPKTGSVMEYMLEEEGKVGNVLSVHPDESIILESVGRLKEGQFLREKIKKEDWLQLRPVWIQVE